MPHRATSLPIDHLNLPNPGFQFRALEFRMLAFCSIPTPTVVPTPTIAAAAAAT